MKLFFRLPAIGLVSLLGACSISEFVFPDPEPARSDFSDTVDQVKKIFPTLKLPGNPEISDIHRNRSSSLAEWALCLRNDASDQRQYYTLFFRNKKITDYRLSVLADGCEGEAFAPLRP